MSIAEEEEKKGKDAHLRYESFMEFLNRAESIEMKRCVLRNNKKSKGLIFDTH